MVKKLYFTICLLFLSSICAQNVEPICGYEQAINAMEQRFPGYKQAVEKQYQEAIKSISETNIRRSIKLDTIYIIPVVFHVIYNNSTENIHDSLIYSQLKLLNECFRMRNSDTGNLRTIFKPVQGDAKIEFVLATKDPNGNPTSGITRTPTSVAQFGNNTFTLDDKMKFSVSGGKDAWNTFKYLNIWICDNSSPSFGDGILGYAYPPYTAPNWDISSYSPGNNYEGVVLHYKIVGKNNPRATGSLAGNSRGITGIHEVGHYLGLRHIFADNNNTCVGDDGLFDTPKMRNRSNFDCNTSKNSCVDAGFDYPDMVENFMDYSSDICENTFTKNQVGIMRYCLRNLRVNNKDTLYKIRIDTSEVIDPPKLLGNNNFTIYPSPVNSKLTIYSKNSIDFSIKVFNVLGQSTTKELIFPAIERTEITGDLLESIMPTQGLYIIIVKALNGSGEQKINVLKTN